MQVRLRMRHQPAQVGLGAGVVLAPGNQLLHHRIEALDADLELQYTGGELRNHLFQSIRQMVGNYFEMHEQPGRPGSFEAVEEKLQDAYRRIDLQVEGAVDELEGSRAARKQSRDFDQQAIEVEGPGGLVQRAQAERALERTAA